MVLELATELGADWAGQLLGVTAEEFRSWWFGGARPDTDTMRALARLHRRVTTDGARAVLEEMRG